MATIQSCPCIPPSSMHCVLTTDIAALVSHHGPSILYRREAVPPQAVSQYWTASRGRFELWHQTMARYRHAEQSGDSNSMRIWWRDHVVVLEEVLVTEMLTRVVAALAAGMESQANDPDEISPVTHAVHLTHLEARNRVQRIMLYGRGNSVQDAVRLNRLRQGVERWTDAMIGRMSSDSRASLRYAIDEHRATEYAKEAHSYGVGPARNTAAWLMNAAMHDMLRRRTSEEAALPEANRAVTKSVMLMLRPELFDSVGVLKSLWLNRLQIGTDRTDRVLHELQSADIDQAKTASGIEEANDHYFARWYM